MDKSYDTDNMILLKRQDDLFRHWIIGLGSGELRMQTMGGRGVEENVSNVLFVIGKISKIQRLVATKPDMPQQAWSGYAGFGGRPYVVAEDKRPGTTTLAT